MKENSTKQPETIGITTSYEHKSITLTGEQTEYEMYQLLRRFNCEQLKEILVSTERIIDVIKTIIAERKI